MNLIDKGKELHLSSFLPAIFSDTYDPIRHLTARLATLPVSIQGTSGTVAGTSR